MKKGICFYVFGFPPDFSGASLQAIKLAKAFQRLRWQCIFVSYTYDKSRLTDHLDYGFKLVRYFRPKKSMAIYHFNALRALFSCRKNFSVIYLNGNDGQFWTACYLAVFCRLFGKKMIMELNMEYGDPLSIKGTFLSMLKKKIANWIDEYICLSNVIFTKMQKEYKELPAKLLFNGVDTDIFYPASSGTQKNALRKKFNIHSNEKIVVTCGAICRRKGIDFLIDVWAKVVKRIKNVQIIFIGPFGGTDDEIDDFACQMIKRAKEEKFSGSISFCGQVQNVEEYFRVADLFVFAGRQEGSPNVLREAMASGLPIVTLELRGITEDMILNEVNGLVVPVEDQEKLRNFVSFPVPGDTVISDFAKGVILLLANESLANKYAQESYKMVKEKFTIKDQANKLIELIS